MPHIITSTTCTKVQAAAVLLYEGTRYAYAYLPCRVPPTCVVCGFVTYMYLLLCYLRTFFFFFNFFPECQEHVSLRWLAKQLCIDPLV